MSFKPGDLALTSSKLWYCAFALENAMGTLLRGPMFPPSALNNALVEIVKVGSNISLVYYPYLKGYARYYTRELTLLKYREQVP